MTNLNAASDKQLSYIDSLLRGQGSWDLANELANHLSHHPIESHEASNIIGALKGEAGLDLIECLDEIGFDTTFLC